VVHNTFNEYLSTSIPNVGDGGPTGGYAQISVYPAGGTNYAFITVTYNATNGWTTMGSTSVSTHNGVAIKATMSATNPRIISVYVDNVLKLSGTTSSWSGFPNSGGIGGCYSGSGNSISHVDVGPLDSVAPTAVPSGSIGVSSFTTHIDLQ